MVDGCLELWFLMQHARRIGIAVVSAILLVGSTPVADAVTENQLVFLEVHQFLLS